MDCRSERLTSPSCRAFSQPHSSTIPCIPGSGEQIHSWNPARAARLPPPPLIIPLPGKEPSLTVVALRKAEKSQARLWAAHAWETGLPFHEVRHATSHSGAKCSKQTPGGEGVMSSELLAPVVVRQA